MPADPTNIAQASAPGATDRQQKESLDSMNSIFYIEDQAILDDEQLSTRLG